MTLEEWFYTLGIAYIIIWTLILIGLLITVFILYKRIKKIKEEIKRSSLVSFTTSLFNSNTLKGLIAVWPIIQIGLSKFSKKRRR